MRYATETHMAILLDNQHPRNFDQMINDRNKRMVTHFITRTAMCATMNSLATPSRILRLWFKPKAEASKPKRSLNDGFEYAYFQNVAAFFTLLSASFEKLNMSMAQYASKSILNGLPHTEMRRDKTNNTKKGIFGKFTTAVQTAVPQKSIKTSGRSITYIGV